MIRPHCLPLPPQLHKISSRLCRLAHIPQGRQQKVYLIFLKRLKWGMRPWRSTHTISYGRRIPVLKAGCCQPLTWRKVKCKWHSCKHRFPSPRKHQTTRRHILNLMWKTYIPLTKWRCTSKLGKLFHLLSLTLLWVYLNCRLHYPMYNHNWTWRRFPHLTKT